jgi:excisionase family DNA binding protein
MSDAPGHNGDRTAELLGRLLLGKSEVAELLGVSEKSIEYLHRVRELPAVKVGKSLHWKPQTVAEFVERLQPGE